LRNKKGPIFFIFIFRRIKAKRIEYQDVVKNSQTILLHKEIKESSEQPKYIN